MASLLAPKWPISNRRNTLLVARLRSDRVFYAPAGTRQGPSTGRGPRHGSKLVLRDPATHPAPERTATHVLERYGTVQVVAFSRMHQRIDTRGGCRDELGRPPIIEGTVVGLNVERLSGGQAPKPMWLWASKPVPDDGGEVDHWWSMYLSRFDMEQTFRFLEQHLGWVRPKLRDPRAGETWTWIAVAAYTLLRLVRPLAVECRLPWQSAPPDPAGLSPARVKATYRRACQDIILSAGPPPIASRLGPGAAGIGSRRGNSRLAWLTTRLNRKLRKSADRRWSSVLAFGPGVPAVGGPGLAASLTNIMTGLRNSIPQVSVPRYMFVPTN